jgi:glycosyltransferase involved in cell wall biosynthesis
MHILFLYNNPVSPNKGGVQRVTSVLANYFLTKDIQVSFLSAKPREKESEDTGNFAYYNLPDSTSIVNGENIAFFRKLLQEQNIDVVINQGAIFPKISTLSFVAKQLDVILISVIHNSLFAKIENAYFTYEHRLKSKHLGFLLYLFKCSLVKSFLKKSYILKYINHYKKIYKYSDKIVLLSQKYCIEYEEFVKNTHEKLISITNPLSFPVSDLSLLTKKEHRILYVGRLDFEQKRVDVLLAVWSVIQKEFPSWRLTIVGDGPAKEDIKRIIATKRLEKIDLVGFCDPKPYYACSSIFCLTSSYEGFGMVLPEAMFFGTVPIGFNSYKVITDIIESGKNGILIKPFNKEQYISELRKLIFEEENLQKMAIAAKEKAMEFSVDIIGNRWISMLSQLERSEIETSALKSVKV